MFASNGLNLNVNIHRREAFRRRSYPAEVADASADGYLLGLGIGPSFSPPRTEREADHHGLRSFHRTIDIA